MAGPRIKLRVFADRPGNPLSPFGTSGMGASTVANHRDHDAPIDGSPAMSILATVSLGRMAAARDASPHNRPGHVSGCGAEGIGLLQSRRGDVDFLPGLRFGDDLGDGGDVGEELLEFFALEMFRFRG